MSVERPERRSVVRGAKGAGFPGLSFEPVFVLWSKPEPEPLPAPPFCGMQVTPAFLKDLYSEPLSQPGGSCNKKAREDPSPNYKWSRTRIPSHLGSDKNSFCLLGFSAFSHHDWPWRSKPEFLHWFEQEIPVSSWERPTKGRFHHIDSPLPTPTLRYRIVSKSYPSPRGSPVPTSAPVPSLRQRRQPSFPAAGVRFFCSAR